MRTYIAEKPTVARAIAEQLGVTEKKDGYILCGNDAVTWCFGHMLELSSPDTYTDDDIPRNKNGDKLWRAEDLPIIPKDWVLKEKDDAKRQIKIISNLVKNSDEVVNAGDPDREGQLLVDELLDHFENKTKVLRYWSNAIDEASVNDALKSLKNNSDYIGLAQAAKARAQADWLIGMNLSRAFTLKALRGGVKAVIPVGRVQTPALNLVVMRDREIESFKSRAFHVINIEVELEDSNSVFLAQWKPKETQEGLDEEGRLVDTVIAKSLIDKIKNKKGIIYDYDQKKQKRSQPLTYSLSQLISAASKKYGYGAESVLKICQNLYEKHKVTTYPRSDCFYLPESQFNDAPNILGVLIENVPELKSVIENADKNIKSRVWNSEKVSAHHAIVPTRKKADISKLKEEEKNIYMLICKSYISQFYPESESLNTAVTTEIEGEYFYSKGKIITTRGWLDVYGETDESDEDDQQILPEINKGDPLTNIDSIIKDKKTKPPARFTEGTLIAALVNIHRFVPDSDLKKLLKDGDGIGTEATRPSILEELKNREFLVTKGKSIISSTIGRSIIDALPEVIKSPVLTALYERMLSSIERGENTLESFIAKQEKMIIEQVTKANSGSVKIEGGKEIAPISTIYKCLSCGSGLSRRPIEKKKGSFWWGCSNYPTCTQRYPDLKGQPAYNKGKN